MARQTRNLRREFDPFTENEEQDIAALQRAGWGRYEAENFIFDRRARQAAETKDKGEFEAEGKL